MNMNDFSVLPNTLGTHRKVKRDENSKAADQLFQDDS